MLSKSPAEQSILLLFSFIQRVHEYRLMNSFSEYERGERVMEESETEARGCDTRE